MPNNCCVPGCSSNVKSKNKANSNVPIFSFPKNIEKLNKWKKCIPREFELTKYSSVCIHHFAEQHIVREDRMTRKDGSVLVVPRDRSKLSDDAFPSIFPTLPSYFSISVPALREPPAKRLQISRLSCSVPAVKLSKPVKEVKERAKRFKKKTLSDEWTDTYTSEEVRTEICFVSVNEERVNESDACEINTTLNSKSKLNSNNKFRKKNKYSKITGSEEEFEIALLNLIFEKPPLFDHTLPIKQRLNDVIDKLWEEVSDELSKYGTFNKSELIGLWQPLRDNYTRYKNSLKNVCSNDSAILPQPKYADILKQLDNIIDTRRLTVSTETDTSVDICSSDSHHSIPMINKSSITIHSCRACLSNDGTLSIYERHNNLLIVVMISDLTNVKMNVAEEFLKTICKSCVEKLYAAFVFKQECENSEKKLQHFLLHDSALKEEPNNISETEFTETDSYIELDYDTDDMNMKAKASVQIKLVDISVEDKLSENYECELCLQSFDNEQSLATHKAIYNKKKSSLAKSAQQYTQIIAEEKINSIGISKEKELQLEKLKCNICFKQFNNNQTFKRHMRRHKTPEFICEICSKPFWTKGEFLQHERLIHLKEKPHKCVECNKNFFFKSSLKIHNFKHTGEKPFECQYCDKTFRLKASKVKHTKLHTGDNKRHQCEICLKRFSLPYNLRIHKRIHTGEKPFKCQYCNLRFIQRSTLKKHLGKIHNGSVFKCNVCEKVFTRNMDLKRHARMHNGDKPYECMHCNNKFKSVRNQRAHTNNYCKSNPNIKRKNATKL